MSKGNNNPNLIKIKPSPFEKGETGGLTLKTRFTITYHQIIMEKDCLKSMNWVINYQSSYFVLLQGGRAKIRDFCNAEFGQIGRFIEDSTFIPSIWQV